MVEAADIHAGVHSRGQRRTLADIWRTSACHISRIYTIDNVRKTCAFWCFSPPARWGLLDFIRVVLLLLLLHHLCLHFHVHFRLANSSPSSSPTSARSGHCWTSTARVWAHWAPLDLTFRAQWAPLDLNLGPSELSEHRWTARRYAR